MAPAKAKKKRNQGVSVLHSRRAGPADRRVYRPPPNPLLMRHSSRPAPARVSGSGKLRILPPRRKSSSSDGVRLSDDGAKQLAAHAETCAPARNQVIRIEITGAERQLSD